MDSGKQNSEADDRYLSDGVENGIRTLAENLGEGLVVIQENRIVYMNDRMADITGIDKDEILGTDLEALFPAGTEPHRYIKNRARREAGENIGYPGEIRFEAPSGKTLEMRNRSSLIQWSGKPATVHFLEDITRRNETARMLVQQTEVNVILTDTVSRILASPLSLEEIAGTVLDSAMGLTGSRSGALIINDRSEQLVMQIRCNRSCSECLLPSVMNKLIHDSERMARSRPGRIEGAFYLNETIRSGPACPDRALQNILRVPARNTGPLSGQIILAESDDPFGPWDLDAMEKVAEVLNLALVRQQAVEDLRKAKIQAENEAMARTQFMANVSHEVRSPLNGVLMMASLLQESSLDEEQSELLGVIMFSARTIDRLIRDLTDINQIRAGKFTVYNAFFDVEELCRHVMETHRPEAKRKGLEMDFLMENSTDRFYGDRERTGQILSNLVMNAVRYTFQGRVILEVENREKELCLRVRDTGVGIPSDQQNVIFDMFRQVRSGDDRSTGEGSGIGLAVVKELTNAMNGRIALDSEPGHGSCFSIYLPEASRTAGRRIPRTDTVESETESVFAVLVADDDEANRNRVRSLLGARNWHVDEAFDGQEAVEMASRRAYDLILMDISMPRMDGLEASARIRSFQPDTPILAMTAHTFGGDRLHILRAGLDGVLRKPLVEDELFARLEPFLRN